MKTILIVGDVMMDKYIVGNVDRISSEAPIPILDVTHMEARAGGAANVANNIASQAAKAILLSVIGDDEAGSQLEHCLSNDNINTSFLVKTLRPTTIKTRLFDNNLKQLFRYDNEIKSTINEDDEIIVLDRLYDIIKGFKIDGIIIQDYDKGLITPKIIQSVMNICRDNDIIYAVDPKKENFLHYINTDLIKPNQQELKEIMNIKKDGDLNIEELLQLSIRLKSKINFKSLLVTLGDKGMFYYSDDKCFLSPVVNHNNIIDVSGAGDTVISLAMLCMLNNYDPKRLVDTCLLGASSVCSQFGVSSVTTNELEIKVDNKLASQLCTKSTLSTFV